MTTMGTYGTEMTTMGTYVVSHYFLLHSIKMVYTTTIDISEFKFVPYVVPVNKKKH